jgi:integrin-linked kinase-associated serine/threonine phosphatase 2C
LQLTSKDRFLLLACDGLWAALSVQKAIELVCTGLNDALDNPDLRTAKQRAHHVAAKLVNEAVYHGSSDNVSVVLVLMETKN